MLMFKSEACVATANLYQRRSNKDPGLINSQFIVMEKWKLIIFPTIFRVCFKISSQNISLGSHAKSIKILQSG